MKNIFGLMVMVLSLVTIAGCRKKCCSKCVPEQEQVVETVEVTRETESTKEIK